MYKVPLYSGHYFEHIVIRLYWPPKCCFQPYFIQVEATNRSNALGDQDLYDFTANRAITYCDSCSLQIDSFNFFFSIIKYIIFTLYIYNIYIIFI